MCGICGIISTDGSKVDFAIIERMNAAMIHRGPDGGGVWISEDGTVGLGHRRLSIVDLSPLGAQPMVNKDNSSIITFNGEIYNHLQLRSELEEKGYQFRSQTDTESLLYQYEQKKERVPISLEGDFAFAIWDEKEKHLFLSRDRAGLKPLYYARTDKHFIFASELRVILASGLVNKEIDDQALYHYLTYLVSPPPRTLIKDIKKLEVGSSAIFRQKASEFKVWKYWEPLPQDFVADTAEMDEEFEDIYNRSVKKRLMADVPTGVLFSGGVDSTLNAATFARENKNTHVDTFNVGIKGSKYEEESDFARKMAGLLSTDHHEVHISLQDMLENIDTLTRSQDEPLSDPVCIPLYYVTKLAREHGTIVLQAGEGADELFCGYSNYIRFLNHYNKYWTRLERMPRSFSSGVHMLTKPFDFHPTLGKISDIFRRHSLGQEFFMASAVGFYETEKQSILSPDFKALSKDWDSYDVVAPFYDRLKDVRPEASFLQCLSFIELNLRLPELLLMRSDKIAMANSIEVRVPFLDHELIEFAMRVPDSFKLRNNIPKEPVKRLTARYAPKETIYRKKSGFGAPVDEWFRGELGLTFARILREQRQDIERFFDVDAILKALARGPRSVNEGFKMWILYNFLNWYNTI